MMPMNKYMDYHPPQGAHFPCSHHYYPSWVPPQTNFDSTMSRGGYEPWGYGSSSYGGYYPAPPECHSCCNHGYPNGYYGLRPPHSHLPPPPSPSPSPFYHHGPYPPYVDNFNPAHYVPPHHSVEYPKFFFDKSKPEGGHCCGCPNHKCNGREEKGVSIVEENEPEAEKKASEQMSLPEAKNYPYPVVWFPPEYVKGKAATKPSESDPRVWNGWFPYDLKSSKDGNKSSELAPKVWNGWSPFDLSGIKSLKQGEGEDRNKEQRCEEKKEQRPHPIIWIPVYDKPEVGKKELKETNASTKDPVEQLKYTSIPMKVGDAEDASASSSNGNVVKEDMARHMTSPQKENGGENKALEDDGKKLKTIPVKEASERKEKDVSSDKNGKRSSPTPPKATKLPPVCLRVDPLPKRKSRSVSPPSKLKVVNEGNATLKSPSSPAKEKVQEKFLSSEEGPSNLNQEKNAGKLEQVQVQVPENEPALMNKEGSDETDKASANTKENNGLNVEAEEKSNEALMEKKVLSPTEAAVLIQSTFRGFEVRKWEPLKKLRQIANVREQVDEVRKQINNLETSTAQKDDKQRVVIGETIMSLLLQLDTIQGLHPNLRDVRKSVARELTCLQEKLDSMSIQKEEGLQSVEVGGRDNIKPAMEDKEETEHDNEHTSAKSTEGSHDLIFEQNQIVGDSSNEPKEFEHVVLEIASSETQEVEPHTAAAGREVEPVNQQASGADIMSGKDSEARADASIKLETFSEKDNLIDEDSQDSSEAMLKVQEENMELEVSPEQLPTNVPMTGFQEKNGDSEMEVVSVLADGVESSESTKVSDTEFSSLTELPVEVVEEGLNQAPETESLDMTEPPVEVVGKPIIMRAQEDITLNSDEDNNCKHDKNENPLCKVDEDAGSKVVALVHPLVQENRENTLVQVFEKEEQLLKESNTTEPKEAAPTVKSNADELSEAVTVTQAVGTPAASLEMMAASAEVEKDNSGRHPEENEVEKPDPSLVLDATSGMSEKVTCEEKEETKELGATDSTDGTVNFPCEPVIVEASTVEPIPDLGNAANINGTTVEVSKENNILIKENEKLRQMLEKLVKAGNEQLSVISDLNGRVKDLEKKLTRNKKLRMRRQRTAARESNCIKNVSE